MMPGPYLRWCPCRSERKYNKEIPWTREVNHHPKHRHSFLTSSPLSHCLHLSISFADLLQTHSFESLSICTTQLFRPQASSQLSSSLPPMRQSSALEAKVRLSPCRTAKTPMAFSLLKWATIQAHLNSRRNSPRSLRFKPAAL